MSSVIGYVRVSTHDQTIENQKQQITDSGKLVNKWFMDEAVSGSIKASEREGFASLLNYIREGDTLIVTGIDRLGRNTINVLQTVEMLQAKGVKIISLREEFDLSTSVGKAMLTMMAGLASLEKDLIAERRTAGIKRAKSEGVHCGRPSKATSEQVMVLQAQGLSPKQIMAELSISKATYYRLKTTA
ncbi:recombinase family protein [Yersinia enterocolitica]|uniref:recombinase family protein n=1 Tax=Yersinia enterocolitica TaxID=630 RepID=UPI0005EA329C|nr:recombinase family protein [Yersinia enterocolitica]CNK92186.1 resolvase TnpR [Yersinia frederiksenii]EKN5159339.1 recombinase family protein [Yersinia enterocolitica]MBX9495198.1 recombinase family protein [Yersinia enterocolitica]HDL7755703.1 recombinase family protein [Yersinia enterocolitica]HDU2632427.1 recombinase family protein [Yersinia enterocolitica]